MQHRPPSRADGADGRDPARQRRTDQRLDVARRRNGDSIPHLADSDADANLQRGALPAVDRRNRRRGRVARGRQFARGGEQGSFQIPATADQPGQGIGHERRNDLGGRSAENFPAHERRRSVRRAAHSRRRPREPERHHDGDRAAGEGAGRDDPHRRARHRHRARAARRCGSGEHRTRPDQNRNRGQRGGHVGAAGRGNGRSQLADDAAHPSAPGHQTDSRRRTAAQHAVPARSIQPVLPARGSGRVPRRRVRGRTKGVGRRRCAVGFHSAVVLGGLGFVRADYGRRDPPHPHSGKSRNHAHRQRPGSDHARQPPAVGAGAGRAGLLRRVRTLAHGLWRRRGHRANHLRMDRQRRAAVRRE